MSKPDLSEFKAKLVAMDDEALVREVAHRVYLSGYAANNPRSKYHAECDATYDEAKRRNKPWLYQRGWNDAYRTCGYEPNEADLAREKPKAWEVSVEPQS